MNERFAVSVEFVGEQKDGSLELRVRSTEDHARLHARPGTIVVTMWAEADGTVRARFEDPLSGATSYLQGNETFLRFGDALQVSLCR